jgi:hypothetical protein
MHQIRVGKSAYLLIWGIAPVAVELGKEALPTTLPPWKPILPLVLPQRWPTRPPPRLCGAPASCCACHDRSRANQKTSSEFVELAGSPISPEPARWASFPWINPQWRRHQYFVVHDNNCHRRPQSQDQQRRGAIGTLIGSGARMSARGDRLRGRSARSGAGARASSRCSSLDCGHRRSTR